MYIGGREQDSRLALVGSATQGIRPVSDSVKPVEIRLQKCFQVVFPTRPISSYASADSFGIYGTYPTHLPVASLLFRCA
jgi:hypothetical protein